MACTIEPTGNVEEIQHTYVQSDWNDFIENGWPARRTELYGWARPGTQSSESPYPWKHGEYTIFMSNNSRDEQKEQEFREIFNKDIENVKEKLENYSWKDGWKDTLKTRNSNMFRLFAYGTAALIGGSGYGPVGSLAAAGAFVAFFEPLIIQGIKSKRDSLINGLEKLKQEGSLKIRYYPEVNYYLKTI
jgi:hypothetical protein